MARVRRWAGIYNAVPHRRVHRAAIHELTHQRSGRCRGVPPAALNVERRQLADARSLYAAGGGILDIVTPVWQPPPASVPGPRGAATSWALIP